MGQTLIGLLQESVVKYASLAALKTRKPDGSFQTLTYAELYTAVKELGTGLIAVGLLPGAHVAILAENNPRWLITDLAILGCGGVDVPLSPRSDGPGDRARHCPRGLRDRRRGERGRPLTASSACEGASTKLRKIVVMEFSGPSPTRAREKSGC